MRRQPPRRRLLALVATARGFLATDGTIRNLQASGDGCACVDFAMPAMTCDGDDVEEEVTEAVGSTLLAEVVIKTASGQPTRSGVAAGSVSSRLRYSFVHHAGLVR